MVNGICPQCGKELQIPQELETFSCLYCGARLTQDMLLQESKTVCDEQAFEQVLPMLASCVREFRGYQKKILRSEFEGAFACYDNGTREIFELLDHGAGADAERIELAAERLLADLEHDWTQKAQREDDKIVIAIFLVPALRRRKLPVSEPFCETLQKKWCERYPKSPFYLGDYESISGGFRKKAFGLCFITTAVCASEGKPDDCEELTAFRAFRDGWLSKQPDGRALIEEYYDIAPGIVRCIELAPQTEKQYETIRTQYLSPCYEDLKAGRMEACKARYVAMVRTLEKTYLS